MKGEKCFKSHLMVRPSILQGVLFNCIFESFALKIPEINFVSPLCMNIVVTITDRQRPLVIGGKVGSKLTANLILPDLLLYA